MPEKIHHQPLSGNDMPRFGGPGTFMRLPSMKSAAGLDNMNSQNIAAIGGGELQGTRFQMFDTQELLGFICEIADGDPLVPDQSIES